MPVHTTEVAPQHSCLNSLFCVAPRQSWWNSAAVALGRERRDRLIQAVFEYAGEEVVMFTSGRQLSRAQAQRMSWEAIAALGELT